MFHMIKIQGISNTYPEDIEGTAEWFAAREPAAEMCDLWEAEEIFYKTGSFKGVNYHLIHYPDGKVHSPFQLQKNVYVNKPVWNNGVFDFLVVDFLEQRIKIAEYNPDNKNLKMMAKLPLSVVENCYNLMLETTPLTLGRSAHNGYYEIVWPERRKIAIGKRETMHFRDGDRLYLSEWVEDPDYREFIIVRDIHTGKILEKTEGYIRRLPNHVVWQI
jgi:hypothetical protein